MWTLVAHRRIASPTRESTRNGKGKAEENVGRERGDGGTPADGGESMSMLSLGHPSCLPRTLLYVYTLITLLYVDN